MAVNFAVWGATSYNVALTIIRSSDSQYWSASNVVFQAAATTVAMTRDTTVLGSSQQSAYTATTLPTGKCFWVAKATGGELLGGSEFNPIWAATGTRTLTSATNLTVNLVNTVTTLTNKTGFELTATGYGSVWTSGTRTLSSATALTVDTVTNVTDKAGYNLSATGYDSVWTSGTRALTDKLGFALSATGLADITADTWAETTRTLTTATNTTIGLTTDAVADIWAATGTRTLTSATTLTVLDLTTKTGFELTATGYGSVWTSGTRTLSSATGLTILGISGTKSNLDDLNDISATGVNDQMLDVFTVDTFAEPGQGVPPATTTLVDKIGYPYKSWRNKMTSDATGIYLYNDDGSTVGHKSLHSSSTAIYTRPEWISGS